MNKELEVGSTRWSKWRQWRKSRSRNSVVSPMFDRNLPVNLVPHLLEHHQHLEGCVAGSIRHHVGSSALDPVVRGGAGANTSVRTSTKTALYRPVLVPIHWISWYFITAQKFAIFIDLVHLPIIHLYGLSSLAILLHKTIL